jgi:hypothetical protein
MKVEFLGRPLPISSSVVAGVLLVLSTPVLAQNDFYKWKDANGTTHYSATPPSKGEMSTVRISAASGSSAQAFPEPAVAASSGSDAALRLANEDYRKRACVAARSDVATVKSGVMLVDGKDPGDSHSLNDQERAKASAAARSRVDQFCSAGKHP